MTSSAEADRVTIKRYPRRLRVAYRPLWLTAAADPEAAATAAWVIQALA